LGLGEAVKTRRSVPCPRRSACSVP
jgi:hypothetical protein